MVSWGTDLLADLSLADLDAVSVAGSVAWSVTWGIISVSVAWVWGSISVSWVLIVEGTGLVAISVVVTVWSAR